MTVNDARPTSSVYKLSVCLHVQYRCMRYVCVLYMDVCEGVHVLWRCEGMCLAVNVYMHVLIRGVRLCMCCEGVCLWMCVPWRCEAVHVLAVEV